LPVTQQAKWIKISRGTVYCEAQATTEAWLKFIRRMDELHLDYPFAGSPMLRDFLRREGFAVGRRHVRTLMLRMGIDAIYRKPNTSKRIQAHKVYPYLLREIQITRANQVWARPTSPTFQWPRAGCI
jgi:putative transposase